MLSNHIILSSIAITLVVISLSGVISILVGLTPDHRKYKIASRYFAMGFFCTGILGLFFILLPIHGEWSNAIKITGSNVCSFIGIYFFRLGFIERSGYGRKNIKSFLLHLIIYGAMSLAFSTEKLLGDHPSTRIALINLSFIIIMLWTFPFVKLNKHEKASFGERFIYGTLFITIVMMIIYPVIRSHVDSSISYLMITTPLRALQLHIWVTGLLVLLLSDVVSIYKTLAIRDGMTGLFNRTYFMQSVQSALNTSGTGSLIVCDLDHFKRINDTYGHSAGDQALKEFSELLKNSTRASSQTAARFGGEEFAIFLHKAHSSEAEAVALNIKKQMANLVIEHDDQSFQFTASFGVCYIPHKKALGEALQAADKALYNAKHSGRNAVSVYN